jgi:hypothetical protein
VSRKIEKRWLSSSRIKEGKPGYLSEQRTEFRIADCEFRIANSTRPRSLYREAEVDGNYKSQNPNNKQIPMTEIQNSKQQHHLKKRIPNMFGSFETGDPPAGWGVRRTNIGI